MVADSVRRNEDLPADFGAIVLDGPSLCSKIAVP